MSNIEFTTDFTAIVADLFDLWSMIFAFDYGRYLIAATLMSVILAMGSKWYTARKIQRRKAGWSDVRREFLYSSLTAAIFSLNGVLVALGDKAGVMHVIHGPVDDFWLSAGRLALAVIAHDAYFYWMHRLMHHPKLFRLVHLVHHRSKTPTPWAAYAFAPIEAFFEALFLPLYLLVLPLNKLLIFIFLAHMIVRNVVGHAGHEIFPRGWLDRPLLRAITTTTHHDLHHSQGRYNYGLYFTWWDRWMGTEHPEYRARFEQVTEENTEKQLAARRLGSSVRISRS